MYGLILENMASTLKKKYGEKTWKEIQYVSGIEEDSFQQDLTYSEGFVHRLIWAAQDVTEEGQDELMELIGRNFYDHVKQYEYGKVKLKE